MRLTWLVVSIGLLAAPLTAARAQSVPAPDAESAYEQQAIGIRHLVQPLPSGDSRGDRPPTPTWDAFGGKDHHPVDGGTFFGLVGRDDLVRRYRHRTLTRNVLEGSGGALIAGGLLFSFFAALSHAGGQPTVGCATGQCAMSGDPSPVWGLAVAGAGVVALIVGTHIDTSLIDADEADRLARDYDRSLRLSLGLTDTARR